MLRRLALPLLLLTLLLGALTWWWWRPVAVPALVLQTAPLQQLLQFSARVASAQRVELGSTLTGRVAKVLVAEGNQVLQGQALLQLEDDEARAALAQALAGERQAQARLAGLRSSGRDVLRAAVAQAESVRVAAAAELTRTQELIARGFVSQARLDEARRALAVAQAQLAGAQAQQAATAEQGSDLAQAQAQLALAQAASDAARARLAQSRLLAPTDAKVLSRLVEPGQIVQPGRALMVLALQGPVQLVAQVDERFLQQLRPGQPASVLADAYPGQRFGARLLRIAPLVDAQRGSVELRFALEVEAAPAFLREDMSLSVAVLTAQRDQALVLPLAALRQAANGGEQVLLLVDGRAQRREVTLGLRTLESAEVLQGLAAGDTVLLGPAPATGRRLQADTAAAAALLASKRRAEDAGSALTSAMGR